jgi:hypothetical protein
MTKEQLFKEAFNPVLLKTYIKQTKFILERSYKINFYHFTFLIFKIMSTNN